VAVFVIGLLGGAAAWFGVQRWQADRGKKPSGKATTGRPVTFRWRCIALPVAILLLTLAITAYFYHLLPAEVAYHFKDGAPDRWMGRGAIVAWMLVPQFLFTLLAGAIIWGIAKLSVYFPPATSRSVEKTLLLMGNMIALPQVILGFAMLNIFSYNAYQIHLVSLWVFALIVMAVGGIVLGIYFILAVKRIWTSGRPDKGVREQH